MRHWCWPDLTYFGVHDMCVPSDDVDDADDDDCGDKHSLAEEMENMENIK